MTVSSKKILDQILLAHIYKYLAEKENASKMQNSGAIVGTLLKWLSLLTRDQSIICKIFKQII